MWGLSQLVGAGKLEEARELCSAQMEEAHAKLSSDADYRAEYFALWEQQRKSPVSMAVVDDDADLAPAKGGRRQQQQQKQQPAVEPAKKAEQVQCLLLLLPAVAAAQQVLGCILEDAADRS